VASRALALRTGLGENGALVRRVERHELAVLGEQRVLRHLVVLERRLEKLALVVENADKGAAIGEQELRIVDEVNDFRGAIQKALGLDVVVLLEKEARDAHVNADFVNRLEHSLARVERNANEHLRRGAKVLFALIAVGELLAQRRHLLLKRHHTRRDFLNRILRNRFVSLVLQFRHAVGKRL
jgi:hypothetical protein